MKTALLIIDMQNDFVLPGRPFCVDGALPSVSNIRKLLDFARSSSWTVIHVIRGTAADAMSFDYDVTVVTDCCSAKTQEVAEANIFDMKNMGIKCILLEEL
ncbi:MAG: isochorismatase family protein [Treponema sp.]|nr:isochorismatase family protein [Treponema sp.]